MVCDSFRLEDFGCVKFLFWVRSTLIKVSVLRVSVSSGRFRWFTVRGSELFICSKCCFHDAECFIY